MISTNTNCCRQIGSFLFVSVFLMGLVANWVTPASAGSGGFSTTGSMNVPRMDHTATLLANGEVLVTGGTNNSTGYLSSAELYNPSTAKWTLTGNMTAPRNGHDAVLLHNGQVLVAGGLNASLSQCGTLASAELYNPSTGTWTATGSMTTGRYSFTLTLLPNGEVLAAGGTNCGNGGLTSAERYNPATGKWTATGSMTVGNETNWAVLLQNGKVLVLNDILYNPTTGTWTAVSKDAIFAHAPVVLLPNGDVYAAGTIQGDSIYNPSTNQWTNFSPPPCTTIHQSCESGGVLLVTGRVLVGGGATFVPARPYPIEETNGLACLFEPSTLTWTTTGSMSTSRFGESMTVLPNGQVLVAGGDTFDKQAKHLVQTTSAEIYTP
jgi:hypothetical protein